MYFRDMLSLLRSFIGRVVPVPGQRQAVVLGRWGIQYDPRIIDCKVFQANEDHCGCCVVEKTAGVVAVGEAKKTMKSRDGDEKIDEYLLPYVM